PSILFAVNRHVQRIVQGGGSLRATRQDFDNFPLLVRGGIAIVYHLVSAHHDLDHVSASWTTNHDPPAKSQTPDLLVIESEVIDAMGPTEQPNRLGFRWRTSAREKRGTP